MTLQTWYEIERAAILQRVEDLGGNRTHAALSLGISVRKLRDRLAEYRAQGFVHLENRDMSPEQIKRIHRLRSTRRESERAMRKRLNER